MLLGIHSRIDWNCYHKGPWFFLFKSRFSVFSESLQSFFAMRSAWVTPSPQTPLSDPLYPLPHRGAPHAGPCGRICTHKLPFRLPSIRSAPPTCLDKGNLQSQRIVIWYQFKYGRNFGFWFYGLVINATTNAPNITYECFNLIICLLGIKYFPLKLSLIDLELRVLEILNSLVKWSQRRICEGVAMLLNFPHAGYVSGWCPLLGIPTMVPLPPSLYPELIPSTISLFSASSLNNIHKGVPEIAPTVRISCEPIEALNTDGISLEIFREALGLSLAVFVMGKLWQLWL